MAIKYFIKYFDVVSVEHRLNIYDDAFVGDAIQVDGDVMLDYSETDDPLEAIRGQGLSVNLEANQALTFSDLWSEEEKTYQVEYKRNGVILFQGWLNPEGFYEDYVSTDWIISFDCVDGLGYLKDLSFVYNDGFPITGRKTYIEVLALALQRTGLYQSIHVDIQIRYTGLSESFDILSSVYANTDRFIKEDGETKSKSTIMSCEDVIRNILEPFGAVLTSFNGYWYIYKPNQLYLNTTFDFTSYTHEGIRIDIAYAPIIPLLTDTSLFVGSNWKGATIHHCNSNQSIRSESSIGAYRVNYKYGLEQSLLENPSLISYDGNTIDDWDILDNSTMYPFVIGEGGISWDVEYGESTIEAMVSNPIIISKGISLKISQNYLDFVVFTGSGASSAGYINYKVVASDKVISDPTAVKYYLKDNLNEWSLTDNRIIYENRTTQDVLLDTILPPPPEEILDASYIYIYVYSPTQTSNIIRPNQKVTLDYFKVSYSSVQSGEIGEFHTVQREDKPSSKVDDVKEVATGDNISDIYEGTIYQTDALTPTITWNRKGFIEEKPLLQIMCEDTLRMSQLPSRVFSGDVYGFFNYLSTVTIDGLYGVFEPIKYSYNTKMNTISAEFRQIYGNELTDIDYKKTFDYGNTVKPTIKG